MERALAPRFVEDAVPGVIVKVAVAVYVDQVYEEANFAGLGIGT